MDKSGSKCSFFSEKAKGKQFKILKFKFLQHDKH